MRHSTRHATRSGGSEFVYLEGYFTSKRSYNVVIPRFEKSFTEGTSTNKCLLFYPRSNIFSTNTEISNSFEYLHRDDRPFKNESLDVRLVGALNRACSGE